MSRKKEKAHRQEKKESFKLSYKVFLSYFTLIIVVTFSTINWYSSSSYATEDKTSGSTQIDTLEEKVFHQKFTNKATEERMSSLENFVFGKTFTGESAENRLNMLNGALQPSIPPPKPKLETTKPSLPAPIKSETLQKKEEPKAIYDESFNKGVVGAISRVEKQTFNTTYNDLPFQNRISNLEDRLLSRIEIIQNRKKSLLDRASALIQKAELNTTLRVTTTTSPAQTPPSSNTIKSQNYTIDLKTGYLIDEQTREIIRDTAGNPITVKIPQLPQQQILTQPNYGFPNQPYLPYGNPLQQGTAPGQIPLDLFLNQQGGEQPEYGSEDLGY